MTIKLVFTMLRTCLEYDMSQRQWLGVIARTRFGHGLLNREDLTRPVEKA